MIEDVEYDINELSDSDFSKAAARLFDEKYHGKASVFPSSNYVDLIETLGGGGGYTEDMEDQMWKV